MHVGEHDFLPTLTRYSADIVGKGILHQHQGMQESINSLRESARDLVGKPASQDELLHGESKIRKELERIRHLVGDQARTQEVLFELARDALAEESEDTGRQ